VTYAKNNTEKEGEGKEKKKDERNKYIKVQTNKFGCIWSPGM
jgi:hypothetical protein